jgi:glycosyltransferase involved in cell wall biosynthesis
MPALTTVIPNYNHGHLIGRQLQAVFSQSTRPAVLIVDDASTDDSVDRIRGLISGHENVRLICRERNGGVVAVMNEALRLADTEFIAFSAADDVVLPGLYEKSLDLLARHPQAALCSAVSVVEHGTSRTSVPKRPAYPCSDSGFVTPLRVRDLLLRMDTWMMGTTLIHRRRCLLEAGGFRPKLRSYCDGFAYLVMALRHGVCFIPEPLAIWHRYDHGYSTSTSQNAQAMAEILREADRLMMGEFAGLFPARLRKRIRRRLLFRSLSARAHAFESRIRLPGAGRVLQTLLFCTLRFHDVSVEVRSRLSKGTIEGAR